MRKRLCGFQASGEPVDAFSTKRERFHGIRLIRILSLGFKGE